MKHLNRFFRYPLTVIYYLIFGLLLVVFHGIQWIALNFFGYKAHKISVDWLQFFIMRATNVLGTRYSFKNLEELPTDAPVIIVSNHQSMYDIPPLIWYLRKIHPKFVSKKELGKGIPSVSYNLRKGGSVLIDRNKPLEATQKLIQFADYLNTNLRSGVIFPEGTRSKNGEMKMFKRKGLLTLIENMPTAYILPVRIFNSWKLQRYGMFPMPLGTHVKIKVLAAIKVSDFQPEALIDFVEEKINYALF
ncbi:MAG TPA: lysophospholipid acyltransferase family protein [Flavobacteriaceae bacterium]|nr:lysophospholipid acyltransferase family protein [Flavobacteriaceae bacterium]